MGAHEAAVVVGVSGVEGREAGAAEEARPRLTDRVVGRHDRVDVLHEGDAAIGPVLEVEPLAFHDDIGVEVVEALGIGHDLAPEAEEERGLVVGEVPLGVGLDALDVEPLGAVPARAAFRAAGGAPGRRRAAVADDAFATEPSREKRVEQHGGAEVVVPFEQGEDDGAHGRRAEDGGQRTEDGGRTTEGGTTNAH